MCKIKVSAEFRPGISRQNFAAEHGEKSLPVITHKNQLTGVSRCFAVFRGEKDDSHKIFLLFK